MDQLNIVIAENLKKLRYERKLSLDNVAKLSGVSKSMLAQIERGGANPSVSTVWKISKGLKISPTQLMNRAEADIELIDKFDLQPLLEDNGKFRVFSVFSFDSSRRFEMYSVEIDPEGYQTAEAHTEGTQEFITVFSGELVIDINGESFNVTTGDSIRFKADSPHAYKNTGKEICTLSMVIYYPQ